MQHLSFHLTPDFVESYADRTPNWGFPIGGGNTLGELTFISKYSRLKEDGTKERWHETCERVINGMFSILKDHCTHHRTPWDEEEAQASAQEAYDRLYEFKWTPPGRGLWMMGTKFVAEQGSAALQNCAFLSTENLADNPVEPFTSLMEMSMLGIGVGFDTRGADSILIQDPETHLDMTYVIPDSREGWVESTGQILMGYFYGTPIPPHDYSQIRPAGEPIRGFGGVAAGPEPLMRLHSQLHNLLRPHKGKPITSRLITDIFNMIGKCVVAGNVRRSAEIAFGDPNDKDFVSLKDWNLEENKDRMNWPNGWGHLSNNSVLAESGSDYSHLIERIAVNGEPGLMYLDLAQDFGRLIDPPTFRDYRVKGANPCVEQSLEDHELCTLVETFPTHHTDIDDYLRTLKFAYMYGKAVTLVPTHWPAVNEVMTRNRRIGTSMTGIAQFVERHGYPTLRQWCDEAYKEIRRRDVQYSEWLGVRESIKVTSVKPSGTVSLLAGVTPGVHWPVASGGYIRRIRYATDDPTLALLRDAGYHVEPDVMDPETTYVVEFPTTGPDTRNEREVSLWEKMKLASMLQSYWADNMVSATFTFRPDEKDDVGPAIHSFDGQLKSMSFLPMSDGESVYRQMPYESADYDRIEEAQQKVQPIEWSHLYDHGQEAQGEKFCANDTCEI